jgi:folylpolyglutamate synthase/dihydropteroate synthase
MPHLALQLDPAPRPQLPCRFEIFRTRDGGVVILDGAHTEQSLRAVAAELRSRFPGRPAAVLFASAEGKRWREGLKELLPTADSVLVTGLSGTTGEHPEIIVGWLRERGCRTGLVADADAGLQELLLRPSPRLVTGSFYLAGRMRTLLRTSGAEHWHG